MEIQKRRLLLPRGDLGRFCIMSEISLVLNQGGMWYTKGLTVRLSIRKYRIWERNNIL